MSNSEQAKELPQAATKAVETADALNTAEVLDSILVNLNPETTSGGEEWNFSTLITDGSLDEAANAAIFGLCQSFGLANSRNDLVQTVMTVITYATLAEIGQHVIGIGTGFAKVDFNGEMVTMYTVY